MPPPPSLTGVLRTIDGATMHIVDGKLHRENGPAVVHPDGRTESWLHGAFQPCPGVPVDTARSYVFLHADGLDDQFMHQLRAHADRMTRDDREALERMTSLFVPMGDSEEGSLMQWVSTGTRAAIACRALQEVNPDAPPLVSHRRRTNDPPRPPFLETYRVNPASLKKTVDRLSSAMRVNLEHVKARLRTFCSEGKHGLSSKDAPSIDLVASYSNQEGRGASTLLEWGRAATREHALVAILHEEIDKDFSMKRA